MNSRLYTAKNVSECFPWISAWTVNHRVGTGALPIDHPSTGTGIPNMFRFPEVVHAAVVDELASLGVFAVQNSTSIRYRDPHRDEEGELKIKIWSGMATDAYYVDYGFYERHEYRVTVEIQLRHDILPGSNIPKKYQEGPGRFYVVTYAPERFEDRPFIAETLDYWLSREKEKFNRLHCAKAFIRVRPLYDLAAEKLGQV